VSRAAVLAILCAGCGSYYTTSGHAAAQGALDDLTSPDAGARYAAVASEATRAAAVTAREELIGPATRADATALVKAAGGELRVQLNASGKVLRDELLRSVHGALGAKTLKDVAALREELAGAPLQADVDALVDSAAPHLAAAITTALSKVVVPVQAAADAEAARWKPIAVAFAIGCGLLLACLGFAGWLIRGHQRTIRALAARGQP
jgi:hypothetical protein